MTMVRHTVIKTGVNLIRDNPIFFKFYHPVMSHAAWTRGSLFPVG